MSSRTKRENTQVNLRTQAVSSQKCITCGVPQGSILVPFLLPLRVNDVGFACFYMPIIQRFFSKETVVKQFLSKPPGSNW